MRYTIPEINIDKLERRINTLRKKCEKYNFDFHYEKLESVYKHFISPEGVKVTEKCYLVDLTGKVLHEGWTLVAKVEKIENGNLIHKFTNEYKIPVEYWYRELTCDHCQTNRRREYTYLLRNESGEWIQVGTACVEEFTYGGLDIGDIAFFAQTFEFASDIQKLDDGTIGTRKFETFVDLREALAFAYREITTDGYVRSGEANSTKEKLMDMLSCINFPEPTSTELAFADDCIKYFAEKRYIQGSEYLLNLHLIAKTEYSDMKHVGFIAAMMNTYIKFLDKKEQSEKENSEIINEHLGEVGDKLTLNIKSWKCMYHQMTMFGDNYLYRFVTDTNHIVTWGTSTRLEEREISTITGTVKEHSDYKGLKQTRLTRCKITYI